MEYKKELTQPLITTPEEGESSLVETELEIQEKIDEWVDRHIENLLNKPRSFYWVITTVEVQWKHIDKPGLEARLREHYVKKLQLVYKETKNAIDQIQQKLTVTKKGVELGLVVYISNELFVDNCINTVKRFFGIL